jgi:hypothetical protein
MPVILPEEHHDAWLSGEAGKEILFPFNLTIRLQRSYSQSRGSLTLESRKNAFAPGSMNNFGQLSNGLPSRFSLIEP